MVAFGQLSDPEKVFSLTVSQLFFLTLFVFPFLLLYLWQTRLPRPFLFSEVTRAGREASSSVLYCVGQRGRWLSIVDKREEGFVGPDVQVQGPHQPDMLLFLLDEMPRGSPAVL